MNIRLEHENINGTKFMALTYRLEGHFPIYLSWPEQQPNPMKGTWAEPCDVWFGHTYLGIVRQVEVRYLKFIKPIVTLKFDWGSITTNLQDLRRLENAGFVRKQTRKIKSKLLFIIAILATTIHKHLKVQKRA